VCVCVCVCVCVMSLCIRAYVYKACELAAIQLCDGFTVEHLMRKVLLRNYMYRGYTEHTTAIEAAIKARALDFLADARVQATVDMVWKGKLLMHDFRTAEFALVKPLPEVIDLRVLRIPQYQYWAELIIWFLFLGIYTLVINNRTEHFTVTEIIMWVFVYSYFVEEISEAWLHPHVYFLSLWNWFSITATLVFQVAFFCRVAAMLSSGGARSDLMDYAFDILGCRRFVCRVVAVMLAFIRRCKN